MALALFAGAKDMAQSLGQTSALVLDGGMFNGQLMNGDYGMVGPNVHSFRTQISLHGWCLWIGCMQSTRGTTSKLTAVCYHCWSILCYLVNLKRTWKSYGKTFSHTTKETRPQWDTNISTASACSSERLIPNKEGKQPRWNTWQGLCCMCGKNTTIPGFQFIETYYCIWSWTCRLKSRLWTTRTA